MLLGCAEWLVCVLEELDCAQAQTANSSTHDRVTNGERAIKLFGCEEQQLRWLETDQDHLAANPREFTRIKVRLNYQKQNL